MVGNKGEDKEWKGGGGPELVQQRAATPSESLLLLWAPVFNLRASVPLTLWDLMRSWLEVVWLNILWLSIHISVLSPNLGDEITVANWIRVSLWLACKLLFSVHISLFTKNGTNILGSCSSVEDKTERGWKPLQIFSGKWLRKKG